MNVKFFQFILLKLYDFIHYLFWLLVSLKMATNQIVQSQRKETNQNLLVRSNKKCGTEKFKKGAKSLSLDWGNLLLRNLEVNNVLKLLL